MIFLTFQLIASSRWLEEEKVKPPVGISRSTATLSRMTMNVLIKEVSRASTPDKVSF
jgi:hypothetical protein